MTIAIILIVTVIQFLWSFTMILLVLDLRIIINKRHLHTGVALRLPISA